jgi:NAD(P)-dependent dehydrogenase (short-subunit alcohol dehydrogenase family)
MSHLGKQVLITGGTSGIGLAMARAFAAGSNKVTVTGLTQNEVEGISIPEIDAKALDVRDGSAVAALVDSFDRLDIVVNCAGTILREGREHEMEGFESVIDVNLSGTARVCYASRSRLVESRGCVVNIASMLSYFGSGYVPAYSASKGGIAQLTKSLAIAWASDGIRVNAVAPGWIKTELTRPLYENPERSREFTERTPMGRWGDPADVSGAVMFLCSPAASFITGTILPVDGGYSIA